MNFALDPLGPDYTALIFSFFFVLSSLKNSMYCDSVVPPASSEAKKKCKSKKRRNGAKVVYRCDSENNKHDAKKRNIDVIKRNIFYKRRKRKLEVKNPSERNKKEGKKWNTEDKK